MQGSMRILALVLVAGLVDASLLRKPKADEIDGFGLTFEIRNYDYFGLTDVWSDPWADEAQEEPKAAAPKSTTEKGTNGIKGGEDAVGKAIEKMEDLTDKALKGEGLPEAFLQLGTRECWRPSDDIVKKIIDTESSALTMMDAMRTAIKTALAGAIECEKSGEDIKDSKVYSNMHVTFRPGTETPNLSLLATSHSTPMLNKPRASLITSKATLSKQHWSVIVDVTITDRAKNGADDLKDVKKFLKKSLSSGQLKDSLRGAIYEVTANAPDVRRIETNAAPIKQWNIDKCEKHISNIVNTFTLHYTRAQVPMALYNECTNFMPKMSFSRDHILDSVDALRCRRATRAFQKHWNFGKNAKPEDFQTMCLAACEAKYGIEAPLCHVTKGKNIKEQPQL